MSTTTIPTYRYQYRPSFSQPSGFGFSLSPLRNTFLPHHHLESPTNIFLSASNSSVKDKLIVRQVGGPGDNHVQWVSKSDIIPYPPSADSGDEELSSSSFSSSIDSGGETQMMKTLKSYTSHVHGIVHTANWANDVGDRLWLRSDQPIIKGRRSVPVVNLDKGVSGEVCISSVTWYPQKQKRDLNTNALSSIIFIGAEYRQRQRRGGGGENEPFRMCITQGQNEENGGEGIISLISLKELDSTCYFEDVKSIKSTKSLLPNQHNNKPIIPIRRQNETHGIVSRSSTKGPMVFEEGNNRKCMDAADDDDDDDDDNLSHASFASSTKGKVALDLVARSLSIFNFNAAMLDLAVLSNQSMGMGMDWFNGNTVNEPPEESDESDEEDEDEEEEKMWSDCESRYSGMQSVIEDEDGDKFKRTRAEDSGGGGDV